MLLAFLPVLVQTTARWVTMQHAKHCTVRQTGAKVHAPQQTQIRKARRVHVSPALFTSSLSKCMHNSCSKTTVTACLTARHHHHLQLSQTCRTTHFLKYSYRPNLNAPCAE